MLLPQLGLEGIFLAGLLGGQRRNKMISTEETKAIVAEIGKEFGKGETDSGSAPVQVAILTKRINNLMPHFEKHIHDYHSNRGLLKMIGQRKRLLKYIKKNDAGQYSALIKKLGLRK
jgi:small subunit ribosomal protein S15